MEIAIPREPYRPSSDEIRFYAEAVRSAMESDGLPSGLIDAQVQLAEEQLGTVNIIQDIRHDAASGQFAIWEQRPAELGDGYATIRLLSADGVYLTKVEFDQAWVDFDFVESTVYALERDPATHVVELTVYEIEAPGTGFD